MSPPRRSAPPVRRFFLAEGPTPFALEGSEAQHALRVLRLGVGDELLGLDGRGRECPLRVVSIEDGRLELEPAGPERRSEPPCPELELAFSMPKGSRAEDAFNMLVQLGVSRVVPLVCARSEGAARVWKPTRRERFVRIAREACKQSGRLWLPEIAEPMGLSEWLDDDGATAYLHAGAESTLAAWSTELERDVPRRLAIGPEGGFDEEERTFLSAAGVHELALGAHVLRTETAVIAAAAIVLAR